MKNIKREDGKKVDPEMLLEGNLKLNQIRKKQFKKGKKLKNRKEKVELELANGLENFSLASDYSFNEDYIPNEIN